MLVCLIHYLLFGQLGKYSSPSAIHIAGGGGVVFHKRWFLSSHRKLDFSAGTGTSVLLLPHAHVCAYTDTYTTTTNTPF